MSTDSGPAPGARALIRGGTVFDGSGQPGTVRDIEVDDGIITVISATRLDPAGYDTVIEADGKWVTPGFLEIHSHYDAEIVTSPGLLESVRHGVTTVVIGNCSLSMATVGPEDAADLFARVEAIPHRGIRTILDPAMDWSTPAEYRNWLQRQPFGPNVAAMLGHSDLRVGVLGLEAATDRSHRVTDAELDAMAEILENALAEGFLGLSTMTTPLDKLAGDRAWSQPLPSTFASWREYRRLHAVVRRRRRVLQSSPNAQTQVNAIAFAFTSMGWWRAPLRVSMLTASDLKANPLAHILTRFAGHVTNRLLRGDLRWQTVPGPLAVLADGIEFNNFEEFSTGRTLRDLRTADDQYALLSEPGFRRRFVKDMSRFLLNGLWHRRFDDAVIVDCPDSTLIGRTFEDLATERRQHPAEVFLDLAVQWRDKLRWQTVLGNHRPRIVLDLLASPVTQIGFADSGAHLRNLALYNFGLRALTLAKYAELTGHSKISVAGMVRKLTSDLADWWGLDAGHLHVGARADLVVIDPTGLTEEVFETTQAPAPDAFDLHRVVNRNDDAVEAVLINGRVAYTRADAFAADFGQSTGYGRFLASSHL